MHERMRFMHDERNFVHERMQFMYDKRKSYTLEYKRIGFFVI